MTNAFKPIITKKGIEHSISTNFDGVNFRITHVSFGGTKFTPTGQEESLLDERLKVQISSSSKINDNAFKIRARAMTDSPFFCQSIAFWSDNILFAVYSSSDLPSSGLFAIHNNSETIVSYTLALEALGADHFEVVVIEGEDMMVELINNHEQDPHAHGIDEIKATLTNISNPDGYKYVGRCKSIEELRTIEPTTNGQRILVDSYYLGGTTGGGEFVYDEACSDEDNAGTVIATSVGNRWKRVCSTLSPEDFGIKGDGTDETQRLKVLLNYAYKNSITVKWTANTHYKFTQIEIEGKGNAKWIAEGQVVLESIKTRPDSNYDNDYAIAIKSELKGETSVDFATIKKGNDALRCTDGSIFDKEDICLLTTTKPIESDDRGWGYVGQTFKVQSKGISSDNLLVFYNNIQIGFGTNDLKYTAKVYSYANSSVEIAGNFLFTREKTINANAGDFGFRGIDIVGISNAKLSDFTVQNFSETGLRLRYCYNAEVVNVTSAYANRSYQTSGNKDNGTGYGFADISSYNSTYIDCKASQCRRGFDASGNKALALNITFVRCKSYGGGLTYEGVQYFPAGEQNNSGIGCHAAGFNIRYIDCEVFDVSVGYSARGHNNTLENCKVYGSNHYGVLMYYCNGLIIKNFIYDDLSYSKINTNDNSFSPSYYRSKRMYNLVRVWTKSIKADLPIVIENATLQGILSDIIYFERTGEAPDVYIGGCKMMVAGRSDDEVKEIKFISHAEGVHLERIVETSQNTMLAPNGATFYLRGYNFVKLFRPFSGYVQHADGTFTVSISKDDVVKIPEANRSNILFNISSFISDRPIKANNFLINYKGYDDSINKGANTDNVSVINSVLTGTTGAINSINLAVKPEKMPYVFIENRMQDHDFQVLRVQML